VALGDALGDALGEALGDGLGELDGEVDGEVDGDGVAPQVTLFTLNDVGLGLLVVQVPLNPTLVEAPVQAAVVGHVRAGDVGAALAPGGRPALADPLRAGEGEFERPAGDRVAEVLDRDISRESALTRAGRPFIGGIDDVAGDCRGRGGLCQRGCHAGTEGRDRQPRRPLARAPWERSRSWVPDAHVVWFSKVRERGSGNRTPVKGS